MLQKLAREAEYYLKRNRIILNIPKMQVIPNQVNLHWWTMGGEPKTWETICLPLL